jgi:hypothetical protein
MTEDDFDANERVAGFSLVSIKRALGWIGIMDDRDDIKSVVEALKCPPRQALRVLEELERRELITKTAKRNQWQTTPKGHRLAFYWLPPRRFIPAIERASRPVSGMGFDSVRCGILRSTADGADMFEEAEIDPAMSVEHEGQRLVEINVTQPHDYDEPHGGARIELSLYLSPAEAKAFVGGLQQAIEAADKETARRAAQKARQEKRAKTRRAEAGKREREKREKKPAVISARTPQVKVPSAKPPRAASPVAVAPQVVKRAAQAAPATKPFPDPPPEVALAGLDERRGEAIAVALKSLRETNRARLKAKNGAVADGKK